LKDPETTIVCAHGKTKQDRERQPSRPTGPPDGAPRGSAATSSIPGPSAAVTRGTTTVSDQRRGPGCSAHGLYRLSSRAGNQHWPCTDYSQRLDNRYKACTDYPAASGYSAQGLCRLSDNLRMFGTGLVPLILQSPDIRHKACTAYPATSGCSAQALCRLSCNLRIFGTGLVPLILQPPDIRHKACTAYPATSGCSAQALCRLSGRFWRGS